MFDSSFAVFQFSPPKIIKHKQILFHFIVEYIKFYLIEV